MSWVPPNLSEACSVYTNITTCEPSTFLFLNLVARLFGQSKDSNNNNKYNFGYSGFSFPASQEDYSYSGFFSQHNIQDSTETRKSTEDEFDFIVVGAGSAGCVVANRLTEIPEWRVLLLEAGDEEPEVADVPAFAPLLQTSSIDWNFRTQPSPHSCLARRNGQCSWARGKVMGGSSTINYMIYIRGHPRDYDEWAEMGNHGWSYREVLPYFLKSEDNGDPEKRNPHYHSVGGYLNVETFPYQDENVFAFLEGYKELGLPIMDQNGEELIGASLLQHTTRDGQRESANIAFIRPIRNKRENLVIRTRAYVTRVLIDSKTKHAYGVEYRLNGKMQRSFAKREVIVSAGSLMTPKILMLSGIGPADHLASCGIEVLKDLAVGYNLQDHTTIDGVTLELTHKTATNVSDEQMTSDVYYYKETHRGPLSSTGPLQSNAFVQTKYEDDHDRPDIQYSIDSINLQNVLTDPVLSAETSVLPLSYYNGVMIRPILLNPKSRGVVRLNNTDPIFGLPLVFANTFEEEIDLLRIVEGVKQSLNLLKTHSLQKRGIRLVTQPWANCRSYKFGSDAYWACMAMSYTTTIYHQTSTCKMGPHTDPTAVVDSELRVHGFKNLRVIDASIMPKIVRGNTNAPTIMIGEKGSDYIKAAWLSKKEFLRYHGGQDFYDEI